MLFLHIFLHRILIIRCRTLVAWAIFSLDKWTFSRRDGKENSGTFGNAILAIVGTLHVAAAMYLVRRHQSGVEGAFHFITNHASLQLQHLSESSKKTLEVHALAPCHAFPGPSFLHSHRSMVVKYIYKQGLFVLISTTLHHFCSMRMILRYPDCSPNSSVATDSMNFTDSPIGNHDAIPYENIIDNSLYILSLQKIFIERSLNLRSGRRQIILSHLILIQHNSNTSSQNHRAADC